MCLVWPLCSCQRGEISLFHSESPRGRDSQPSYSLGKGRMGISSWNKDSSEKLRLAWEQGHEKHLINSSACFILPVGSSEKASHRKMQEGKEPGVHPSEMASHLVARTCLKARWPFLGSRVARIIELWKPVAVSGLAWFHTLCHWLALSV